MVADVYADYADPAALTADDELIEFLVEADPAPDALCRLAGIISLTNSPPYSTRLVTQADDSLAITVAVRGVAAEKADLILGQLKRLTCVIRAESHRCAVAGSPSTGGSGHPVQMIAPGALNSSKGSSQDSSSEPHEPASRPGQLAARSPAPGGAQSKQRLE